MIYLSFWENRNFKFPVYFKEILYLCVDCLRMNEITTLKTWQKKLLIYFNQIIHMYNTQLNKSKCQILLAKFS